MFVTTFNIFRSYKLFGNETRQWVLVYFISLETKLCFRNCRSVQYYSQKQHNVATINILFILQLKDWIYWYAKVTVDSEQHQQSTHKSLMPWLCIQHDEMSHHVNVSQAILVIPLCTRFKPYMFSGINWTIARWNISSMRSYKT